MVGKGRGMIQDMSEKKRICRIQFVTIFIRSFLVYLLDQTFILFQRCAALALFCVLIFVFSL